MRKNKPVSTRVTQGKDGALKVILSKSRQRMLADATPKERKRLTAKWSATAIENHKRNAVYEQRKTEYGNVVSEDGKVIVVTGTGTRRAAVFTKAQALIHIQNIDAFEAAVNGMPDQLPGAAIITVEAEEELSDQE